jgi:Spy/CpxP family protein refolding chaperone
MKQPRGDNHMRHIRWVIGAIPGLVLAAGLGLAGCDKESPGGGGAASASASASAPAASSVAQTPPAPTGPPQTVAADDAVNEALRDYHRHHHGGLSTFISMALDTLGLDEARKLSIAKIQSDLRAKAAPARDAENDLLSAIADGVAAGKVDTAKVDAAVEKHATAAAAVHAATADALTQLHDALAPAERAALVDKVKAHWEVWHKVNVEERANNKDEKAGHLGKLTKLLGLAPDQVDKISATLAAEAPVTPKNDPKAEEAHIQAFATAFVGDKFDAKSLATSATASAGHVARHGGARLARFYEAVVPVLTPAQRTTLAAELRERLNDDQIVK